MPPTRKNQNNAVLLTLAVFVGLFLIALVAAIIYYVKFEDQREIADDSVSKLNEVLSPSEQRKGLGKIVGALPSGKSGIGVMATYLDQVVSLILGEPLEATTAEVKVGNATRQVQETLESLAEQGIDITDHDPNTTGLTQLVEDLKSGLKRANDTIDNLKAQLKEVQDQYDVFETETRAKEEELWAREEAYKQQVYQIKQDYNDLEALLKESSDERAKILIGQRDQARAERDQRQAGLLQTRAKLAIAQERIIRLQGRIDAQMAPFDGNVPAYKPDGQVMLVDGDIVQLNIGSDSRVYRGLTLAVYDKGMPVPKDGRGKAEIEVFDVGKNVSAARVVRSQLKRPVVVGDIVANLIWDSDRANAFVVTGEFDLNGDGQVDYGAVDKIEELIGKWGGRAFDNVSVETDFLVLGRPPATPRTPTAEEMEADPLAMEKYQAAAEEVAHYNSVKGLAKDLRVPVFNTERFLYFIGYKALAARPDAF